MLMKNNRGRPLGYRLSEESKRAISEAKKGQKHSEATKDKISKSLISYFRLLYPLSRELYEDYQDLIDNDDEIAEWFSSITQELDTSTNFMTEKSLNSRRMRELSIEMNMDLSKNINVDSFKTNPEKMCELRLLCKQYDLDMDTILILLDTLS